MQSGTPPASHQEPLWLLSGGLSPRTEPGAGLWGHWGLASKTGWPGSNGKGVLVADTLPLWAFSGGG